MPPAREEEQREAADPGHERERNASPATSARAPPNAGPSEFPAPQAAFMSPKPSAWASPIRSAPSESSAIAGAQNEPNAIAAATTSGAMKTGRPARASPEVTTMAAPEASLSGSRRPRRSEKRPRSGATTISIAAAPTKSAAIAAAPQPASPSSSGTSTARTPKRSAGSTINQSAPRMSGCRTAPSSARGDCGSETTAGVRSAQTASTTDTPATPTNAGRVPTASAKAPTAGPSNAPKMAAPIAVPSISPRRSRGVPATSQASEPAQEIALPNPCASRASPSSAAEPAKPNAMLANAMSTSPATTARRGPKRAAAIPPGIAPMSAPSA